MPESSTATQTMAAVTVKLPTFWPQDTELWFIQAEAQFQIRGITLSATKYHHAVAALDAETASRCRDVLRAPPSESPYESLKQSLLGTFSCSEYQRASKLINMPPLGDASPSKLLDEMFTLLGDHTPCFLFRALFLERLPMDIRMHLTGSTVTDIRELARLANDIWVTKQAATVNEMEQEVEAVKINRTKTPKFDPTLCRYHAAYGLKARKCISPCRLSQDKGNGTAGRF